MQTLLIEGQSRQPFQGRFVVPGDKSIAQRVLLLAAMAQGETVVEGVPANFDCQSMLGVISKLGAQVCDLGGGRVRIVGWGQRGPEAVEEPIDCGNSGTCMRLTAGVLSMSAHTYTLIGDPSLKKRSMRSLVQLLSQFGAQLETLGENDCPPLRVRGTRSGLEGEFQPLEFTKLTVQLPTSSAQLKTAALLAALSRGNIELTVREPFKSRDHSEILLRELGYKLREHPLADGGHEVTLKVGSCLVPALGKYRVFGDPSSAAFLIALALLRPHSHIVVDYLNINPTRMGFYAIARRMGANICARYNNRFYGELVGGITADYSHLQGVEVQASEVPLCLDEVPLLAVLASRARGVTRIRGAETVRHKESDRISSTLQELAKLGIRSTEHVDGFDLWGQMGEAPRPEKDAGQTEPILLQAHGDHRVAMSLGVAACLVHRPVQLEGFECAAISYPEFWETLKRMMVIL